MISDLMSRVATFDTLCLNNPVIGDKGHLPDSLAGMFNADIRENKMEFISSLISVGLCKHGSNDSWGG